jgi:predicted RNA-binding Zn ribbon-like protein
MEAAELMSLGDDPALNFLNSKTAPGPGQLELIGDGAAFLGWLAQAGLLAEGDARAAAARFSPAELDAAAAEAVELREFLRPVVGTWAGDAAGDVPPAAVDRLNAVLARDGRYPVLERDRETGQLALRACQRWEQAAELVARPAAAVASLLATADRDLVRRCESPVCTLLFYDRTKSHRRRWCSMAACGNRVKAQKHRDRRRVPVV